MAQTKQIFDLSDIIFLTDNSKNKINQVGLNLCKKTLDPSLKKLLNSMIIAFSEKINIEKIAPLDAKTMRNIFIQFNRSINNVTDSKLELDVGSMNIIYSINLKIVDDTIKINFLTHDPSKGLISAIIHSLHTFCYLFPYNYNGLVINICLDENKRDIVYPSNNEDILSHLLKNSLAFNASGVTYRSNKLVILTKKEEIIKLMFHEMVHFIGLDNELLAAKIKFNWEVVDQMLNLSEAYTEFMAIVLYAAYESIHLASLKNLDVYDTYNNFLCAEKIHSIYLTSNILKFYGYDNDSYINFFKRDEIKNYSPISIWEYVIVRTQLFINLDKVANILGERAAWSIDSSNVHNIIDLMKTDDVLLDELSFFMEKSNPIKNISYIMIDFDWNLV